MLTIQPNLTTNRQFTQKKPLHFKGQEFDVTEDYVNEQRRFYEDQIKEADKIINDERAPKTLKKGMRLAKIISEGVIEGWAVLWGATQGSKIAKNGTVKAINSKVAKNIASGAKKAGAYLATGLEAFGKTGIAKKAVELVEKLNNTKYGKYIVSAGKAVVKAVKAVIGFVKKGFDKIKGKNVEEAYDKASKGVATTLGVGSGIAGSYSAAKKTAPKEEDIPNDNDGLVEDEDDVEGLGD